VKKILLKVLVPFLISALALWAVTKNVRWDEVKNIMIQARLTPFILGFFISLSGFYLRAWRWKILLIPFQNISLWPLIRWQVGGILINNLLPLRAGEFARAYWAGHKTSVSKSTLLATIVMERVFDVGALAVITLCLLGAMNMIKIKTFLIIAAGGLLVLGIWRIGSPQSSRKLLDTLLKRLPEKIAQAVKNFISGLHILKNGKEIVNLVFLSSVIWSMEIIAVAVISRSLGLNLSWTQAGLTMAGLVLGIMIPAAPGAVGTYEAGGVHVLTLLGFDSNLAFSFIALLHVFQMGAIFVLGIPSLMIEGFNPKQLYREMTAKEAE